MAMYKDENSKIKFRITKSYYNQTKIKLVEYKS